MSTWTLPHFILSIIDCQGKILCFSGPPGTGKTSIGSEVSPYTYPYPQTHMMWANESVYAVPWLDWDGAQKFQVTFHTQTTSSHAGKSIAHALNREFYRFSVGVLIGVPISLTLSFTVHITLFDFARSPTYIRGRNARENYPVPENHWNIESGHPNRRDR